MRGSRVRFDDHPVFRCVVEESLGNVDIALQIDHDNAEELFGGEVGNVPLRTDDCCVAHQNINLSLASGLRKCFVYLALLSDVFRNSKNLSTRGLGVDYGLWYREEVVLCGLELQCEMRFLRL